MAIDLNGCRAKIERAHEHRHTLEAIVSPIEDETPQIQVSAEFDPHSRYYIFRVAAIPEDWRLQVGVMIGDVVHNTRSALDHLFWQLADHYIPGVISKGRAKRIQFPIEDTSYGFAQKRKALNKIPFPYWTIIDGAQPYNRGNSLGLLRDLSNNDKHRVLTPVFIRAERFTPTTGDFKIGQVIEWDNAHAKKYLEVGAEVTRVKFAPSSPYPEADVEVTGYITPHVLLPQEDLPVIRGLSGIIADAEKVVSEVTMHLRQLGIQA